MATLWVLERASIHTVFHAEPDYADALMAEAGFTECALRVQTPFGD